MGKMTPQPAIKSYFFGKGYSDLRDTILDSWQRNLDSAKFFWEKTIEFWGKGFPTKLMSSGSAFAALSVVLFGTLWFFALSALHIIILFLIFLCIYTSFSFLWIIERLYMYWHKIFVVCPHCHEKYDLPHYVCQNCRAVHTRLIPCSYGILKRTCLCGNRLPTTFYNGRKNLEAKCLNPNCNRGINVEISRPICIPIIGGPTVGKTCYLAAASKCFVEKLAPSQGWMVRFNNTRNQNVYNLVTQNYSKGIVPRKTPELNPTAFNFFIESKKWTAPRLMYFYDSAGEAFQSTDELVSHKFYGFLNGFIFIIDPFSIPQVLNAYEKNFKIYKNTDRIRPSKLMLEDCFDTMLINLEKNHKIRRSTQIDQPCAIIINKVDVFDLEDRIGLRASRRIMMRKPDLKTVEEATNFLCEELFTKWELGNFIRKLKSKFKNYRFYTCSALGRIPDDSGKPFQPSRVEQPLIWILSQADKNLKIS